MIYKNFRTFLKESLNEDKDTINDFEVLDKFITVDGKLGFFDKFMNSTEARVVYIENGSTRVKTKPEDWITAEDIDFSKTTKINRDIVLLNNKFDKEYIYNFDIEFKDYKNGKLYFHIDVPIRSNSKDDVEQALEGISKSSIFSYSNFDNYKKTKDEMIFNFSVKM